MLKQKMILILLVLCILPLLNSTTVDSRTNFTTSGGNMNQSVKQMVSANNPIPIYSTNTPPNVLDGEQDPVWNAAGAHVINFSNGTASLPVNLYVLHDNKYFYFAFEYYDATPNNASNQIGIDLVQMILDINESTTWNQAGPDIFDVIEGTWNIGTLNPYVADMFENSTDFYSDTSVGGSLNAIGYGSYNFTTHTYFYELAQEMQGNDTAHDINLHIGDSILFYLGIKVDGSTFVPSSIGTFTIESSGFANPAITILQPQQNDFFNSSSVLVNFKTNITASWIGYSLDSGSNITITSNFTLSGLSNQIHDIIIFANDSFGNMGKSVDIIFAVSNYSVVTSTNNSTLTTTITVTKSLPGFSFISLLLLVSTSFIIRRKKNRN